MKICIILNGGGGELDRTELEFDREPEAWSSPRVQERILAAIAAWQLEPGDTIVIEGDE